MRLHSAQSGVGSNTPETHGDTAGPFEQSVLPHLSSAYTLARYLTGNADDAEDAVQEAVLRAVRYFHTLRDENARAWFLTIVRRVCFTSYTTDFPRAHQTVSIDSLPIQLVDQRDAPDAHTDRELVRLRIRESVEQLPPLLRETLILREIQECSYAEIAAITESPIGTVMSRLARARARVAEMLKGVVDFGESV